MIEAEKRGRDMNEYEHKVMAYLAGIVYRIASGDEDFSYNDVKQLENIADELGTWDLDEREFRY